MARDVVHDASAERIAPLEDSGSEGIGMDVQADRPAFGAERWLRSGGLIWR